MVYSGVKKWGKWILKKFEIGVNARKVESMKEIFCCYRLILDMVVS